MHPDRLKLERIVLSTLCQGRYALLGATLPRLAAYRFRGPLHQVIFEEVSACARTGVALPQGELQARLTRRGFPAADLEHFYAADLISTDARGVVEKLLDLD